MPTAEPRAARKRWIAGSVQTLGVVIVDDGAVNALHGGKSLLPAGVVDVSGDFERGDAVEVRTKDGRTIGKGLSAYAAADMRAIKGRKSEEIETILVSAAAAKSSTVTIWWSELRDSVLNCTRTENVDGRRGKQRR